jgi:non-specific serine/threonine protein kinase/serine/threonine-protein kinase
MDRQRWRQIEEIYHAALEQEPSHRDRFLDVVCQEDHELRRQLDALLEQEANSGIMDRPLWSSHSGFAADSPRQDSTPFGLPPDSVLGGYRILRLIGEGGMGAVYEAEQIKPRRTVALKVIKPALASEGNLRRFELESQALARLQHPGIAQIYEAGSTDAGFGPQPYFAMEFIRGVSLARYAEEHTLPLAHCLELVARICDAIHHAHQRGIIHRDLKPGNILVDESGQPKILDFGVARFTGSGGPLTQQTSLGQIIGTLAYMSPEQVLADPFELDIRSDVYSLGVILYELLARRLPYTLSSRLHEAARTICRQDPVRLASIRPECRGDVETITGKALEKDKSRRYDSAAALAADIRRYLNREPILARPASVPYQLQRFAQRNRTAVSAAALVLLLLLAGVAATSWQAVRARRAQQQAILERDRALAAERLATEQRNLASSERKRALQAEALMLEERNRALAERSRAEKEAAASKAISDFLQDDLLAQAGASSQSSPNTKPDPDLTVRAALDRAAARVETKFAQQPLVEAAIQLTIAMAYVDLGLYDEAEPHYRRSLQLREHLLGADHPDTLESSDNLASLYYRRGQFDRAETLHRHAFEVRRRVFGLSNPDTLTSMNNLADTYRAQHKYPLAEPLLKQTLAIKQRVLGIEAPSTLVTMSNLGLTYLQLEDYARAEPIYAKVLEIRRRVLGPEHPRTIRSAYSLASLYWYQGKHSQAESMFQQIAATQRRLLGPDHPDTLLTLNALARVYIAKARYPEAEALLTGFLPAQRKLLKDTHPSVDATLTNFANLYIAQGKHAQAEPYLSELLDIRRRTHHPDFIRTVLMLGNALLQQHKFAAAEALLRDHVNAAAAGDPLPWLRFSIRGVYGVALAAQQQFPQAEALLTSAYEGIEQNRNAIPPKDYPLLRQAGRAVIRFYQETGQSILASRWEEVLRFENTASSMLSKP